MNSAQIQGIIRSIVLTVGGITSAVGWLSSVDWASIAGALATLGGLAWSIYSNADKQLIDQASKVTRGA